MHKLTFVYKNKIYCSGCWYIKCVKEQYDCSSFRHTSRTYQKYMKYKYKKTIKMI